MEQWAKFLSRKKNLIGDSGQQLTVKAFDRRYQEDTPHQLPSSGQLSSSALICSKSESGKLSSLWDQYANKQPGRHAARQTSRKDAENVRGKRERAATGMRPGFVPGISQMCASDCNLRRSNLLTSGEGRGCKQKHKQKHTWQLVRIKIWKRGWSTLTFVCDLWSCVKSSRLNLCWGKRKKQMSARTLSAKLHRSVESVQCGWACGEMCVCVCVFLSRHLTTQPSALGVISAGCSVRVRHLGSNRRPALISLICW